MEVETVMEPGEINYVQLIVEEGSISDAAKRLNISQPALSARIKKIEESYGIRIFQKNRRFAVLTGEGRAYLDYTQKAANLERNFRRLLSDSQDLKSGEIRIGGTHLYTQCFLPQIVREFHEKYPGVSIRVINEKIPELTSMAAKGELDLFISSPGKKSQGIIYEPLTQTRLYFCVPREDAVNERLKDYAVDVSQFRDPDLDKKSVDLREFADEAFILLDEQQHMGRVMRGVLKRCGVEPKNVIHTDQAMTAYAMTDAGAGICLMFDRTIEQAWMKRHPYFYTTSDPELKGNLYVAWPEQTFLPAAAREFIRTMKEKFKWKGDTEVNALEGSL